MRYDAPAAVIRCVWLVVAVAAVGTTAVAQPADAEATPAAQEPAKQERPLAEWQPFDPARAGQQLADWSARRGGTNTAPQQWQELVQKSTYQPTEAFLLAASSELPALAGSLQKLEAVTFDEAQALVIALSSSSYDPLLNANLSLWAGIRLTHQGYYDEALQLLSATEPDKVVDPAALLFYRGLVEHQLVKLEDARWSLESLLQPDYPLPARYEQLAQLLLKDLQAVEPESLGAIARQMNDVYRRLALGAADKQVQMAEDELTENLDKLIEKLEEQQRQQQQQQQQAMNPGTPMDDSRQIPLQAAGDADIRDVGRGTGWGSLPPKERERVIQQIGRDFPAHYREVIEEYFRRLATDQREPEDP